MNFKSKVKKLEGILNIQEHKPEYKVVLGYDFQPTPEQEANPNFHLVRIVRAGSKKGANNEKL